MKVSLRPIAYGTGLSLLNDGKLRIIPLEGMRNEIIIQERPRYGITYWSINESTASGSSVLDRNGDWIFEPQPSSRTDEYLASTRYATLAEAVSRLERYAEDAR